MNTVSVDEVKARAVLENALQFMADLLLSVGAKNLSRLAHDFQKRASETKILPDSLVNKGTFGDVLISAGNGHKVTDQQQPWINVSFEFARSLAVQVAEFLWIHDRLVEKEHFTLTMGTSNPEIVVQTCSSCGGVAARRRDVDDAAAIAWAQSRVIPLISTGKVREALAESLRCVSCFAYSSALTELLVQKNFHIVADYPAQCTCGGPVHYSQIKIEWDSVEQIIRNRRN